MARIAFLGTPELAVPFLTSLVSRHQVVGVVTRPDAARGRSKRDQASPVAVAAAGLGIPVERPRRSSDLSSMLGGFGPLDVAVVVAFGALIPPEALSIPHRGFLNVHFSLLPRWRGAAPVQRAILARDPRVGVTIMKLDEGLDTGPYLGVASVGLEASETAGDVFARLTDVGVALLTKVLQRHLVGGVVPVAQVRAESRAPKIEQAETRLSFGGDPAEFVATVMAFSPRPGAWAVWGENRLRVLRARCFPGAMDPGALVLTGNALVCGVGKGSVELIEVQPAGGRVMRGSEWARGRHDALGRLT